MGGSKSIALSALTSPPLFSVAKTRFIPKVSFLRFFQIFGPILLVILGIFLVIVFGIQQNPAFHFHYDEEEYETENDDPALSFNGEAEE